MNIHRVLVAGNKFTNSRLVWLEELPDGDRIREQMYYVPKGYAHDETPMKRILVYRLTSPEDWEIVKIDQGEFVDCPVSQCLLTENQSLGAEVDAVLFKQFYSRPKHKRPPNQVNFQLILERYFKYAQIIVHKSLFDSKILRLSYLIDNIMVKHMKFS